MRQRWSLGCEMTSEINTNRKKALWSARLVSSWSLIEDMEVMQANQIRLLSKGHAMRCCIIMWHLYKYRNPAVVADYATTAKIWPLFAPLVELSRTVIIHGDKPEPSPKKVLPPSSHSPTPRLLCPSDGLPYCSYKMADKITWCTAETFFHVQEPCLKIDQNVSFPIRLIFKREL